MKYILRIFLTSLIIFPNCSLFLNIEKKEIPVISFPLEIKKEIEIEGKIINGFKADNNSIFFTTEKNYLYCYNFEKNNISWKTQLNEKIITNPKLGEKYIYLFSENKLFCIEKETGNLLWEKEINYKKPPSILENKNIFFLGIKSGIVQIREVNSGKLLKEFKINKKINSNLGIFNESIIFTSESELFSLNESGKLFVLSKFPNKIKSKILRDKYFLFFGCENGFFYCYDLKKRKVKWKINVGGDIILPPVTDEKRVYFTSLSNAVYCIDKKRGYILWWKALPSRTYNELNLTDRMVLISCISNELVAFEKNNGNFLGKFKTQKLLNTNPLTHSSRIILGIYDYNTNKEKLLILEKKIAVELTSDKTSPQKVGEEIIFKAKTIGLINPKFEFYIKLSEEESYNLVKELSSENEFSWIPEKQGNYNIKVIAKDIENTKEATMEFKIEKE